MALTNCALWLSDRYSTIGTQLSFSETTYNNIIADALETLDITSESDVETIVLHKVAVYEFWKKCLTDVSLDIDFNADGASYNRSEMHKMISDNYARASAELSSYIEFPDVIITEDYPTNPYRYDEARDEMGNY